MEIRRKQKTIAKIELIMPRLIPLVISTLDKERDIKIWCLIFDPGSLPHGFKGKIIAKNRLDLK